MQLPLTTINKNQVGQQFSRMLTFAISALEYLLHRGIIVACLNALYIIITVFGLNRAFLTKYHAGCLGRFTHGMTDIKTFYAFGSLLFKRRKGTAGIASEIDLCEPAGARRALLVIAPDAI